MQSWHSEFIKQFKNPSWPYDNTNSSQSAWDQKIQTLNYTWFSPQTYMLIGLSDNSDISIVLDW
jgi:hypothetical protein